MGVRDLTYVLALALFVNCNLKGEKRDKDLDLPLHTMPCIVLSFCQI